jgi:hypothetical protein
MFIFVYMLKIIFIRFTLFLVLASFISVAIFQGISIIDEEETSLSKESKGDVEDDKLETSKDKINEDFVDVISGAILRLIIPKLQFSNFKNRAVSSSYVKIVIPPPEC